MTPEQGKGVNIQLRVHREFMRSLEKLAATEQQAVQRMLTMIAQGASTPGMRFHKVGSFLSISPTMDLRVIAARSPDAPSFIYVDHHDAAYKWAGRHKAIAVGSSFELFPLLPEVQTAESEGVAIPLLLDRLATVYGKDDAVLEYIAGLSPEWQEWFFQTYIEHIDPAPQPPSGSSLTYCCNGDSAVEQALELSSEEWRLFLHPLQQEIVNAKGGGTIVVMGGPGTGKTIVLLSRLLREPARPGSVKVLLTYSQSLVRQYRDLLRCVRLDVPQNVDIQNANDLGGEFRPGSFGFEFDGKDLFRVGRVGRYRRVVDELLIDEFQDCESYTIDMVKKLQKSGMSLIIGLDMGQSIFRKNWDRVDGVLSNAKQIVTLTYCYRSSRQISQASADVKHSVNQLMGVAERVEPEASFALSGAPVTVFEAADMTSQIAICEKVMEDLAERFDPSEVALIYLQYPNPAFKGPSKEEAALKNHPRLKRYYQFAPLTKGREYWAGAVFVSSTYLARNMGSDASALRANMLYVAMSRFRDELAVVYPAGCPLAAALSRFAQLSVKQTL